MSAREERSIGGAGAPQDLTDLACRSVGEAVSSGRLSSLRRVVVAGRTLAVKQARPGIAEAAAALRREARVLTAAAHPCVVPVLGLVEAPAGPAMVLEWAAGGALADAVQRGLDRDDLLDLLGEVAAALAAFHRAGELHGDVTPTNVLIGSSGPWLADPSPPRSGTQGWVAPEVVASAPPSIRSDVFGLAVTASWCLTCEPVRAGGSTGWPALDAALDPDPRSRPRTPCELVRLLRVEWEPRPSTERREPEGRQPPAELPRTWPFNRLREEAERIAAEHESIRDCTGSTHDTARVTGWRKTRRGG